MRRRTVFVLLSLLLVGLAIAFFFIERKKESSSTISAAPLPAALVVSVIRGTIQSKLTVSGQFTPYQEVDLHAKVSGYIRRINVDIGDRVRNGQVIATLEVPELLAQVAGAKAEVKHSQSEIARAQSEVVRAQSAYAALHAAYTRLDQASKQRPGLIAAQELDDALAKDQEAQAQIDVAKSALEASQQQLGVSQADNQRAQALSDYSVVTAPFNGVITTRYADAGSLIQAGTTSNTQAMPVVRVAQSDLLRLRMPVPEDDVRFIRNGGVVQVNVGAIKSSFAAKIIRFTRALDASTRTMLAEVDVPNATLLLTPGMYAETNIVLQRSDNVLIVPAQAIIRDEGQPYLLVVNKENKVERRSVQTGVQGQNKTEVTGDLHEGESVVVSGQTNYQPGEHVRPQKTSLSVPVDGGAQ